MIKKYYLLIVAVIVVIFSSPIYSASTNGALYMNGDELVFEFGKSIKRFIFVKKQYDYERYKI